ncbi:putative ribonuclease H-like domain-containing protein [Tanacetum coccineum]
MAHVNFKTINKLAKEGLVDGLPLKVFTNEHNCVACNKGKQHKASYKHISAVRLITDTLQLLHMDLFGPTNIRKFITLIENQLNKKVKGIRCDNGTEFKNAKLIELCGEKGIKRDYSNPRTPQQNGVAERKNRTLIEAARTMLADSKLPTMFWTEAVSTACTHETNIKAGTQDHDSDSEVDEQVIVVPSFPSNRFAAKDAAARYGYLFSQATAEILCQAEAEIRNQGVPCKSQAASVPAGSSNSSASITADGPDPAASRNRPAGDPSTDNDIGIVDSGCSRSMTGNKEKLDDFVQIKGGIVKFGGGDGRISGKGTIRTSNQQVWKLVPLPAGKHAIRTKWILKNKRDARGIVVRNKARLVAQGHQQEEGYQTVFGFCFLYGLSGISAGR